MTTTAPAGGIALTGATRNFGLAGRTSRDHVTAGLADGRGVLLWLDDDNASAPYRLLAQFVDAGGAAAGDPFVVSSVETDAGGTPHQPQVAALAGGGFVVSFNEYLPPPDAWSSGSNRIRSRIVGADGSLGASVVTVASNGPNVTAGSVDNPAVAGLADGGFVVVCDASLRSPNGGVANTGLLATRYTASGAVAGTVPIGSLDPTPDYPEPNYYPQVAGLQGGGYALAWFHFGDWSGSRAMSLHIQAFGPDDRAAGPVLDLGLLETNDPRQISLAGLSDGRLAVAWSNGSSDTSHVRVQIVGADGSLFGSPMVVDTTADTAHLRPKVVASAGGGFVVEWEEFAFSGPNRGNAYDIHARAFDAAGRSIGAEAALAATTGDERVPTASPLVDGTLLVGWEGAGGITLGTASVAGPPAMWRSGAQGDAGTAANWVGGVTPVAGGDVVIVDDAAVLGTDPSAHSAAFFNGTYALHAISADFSKGASGGVLGLNGPITLSGALTMTGSPTYGQTGRSWLNLGNSDLTVAGGLDLDAGTEILAQAATVHGTVRTDGLVNISGGGQEGSRLTIDGDLTGAGMAMVGTNGVLDLDGASDAAVYLTGGTLRLDQGRAMTGTVTVDEARDGAPMSRLDLRGGGFGGSLQFFAGSVLDLVGVDTARSSSDGTRLHITETDGDTLDLIALYLQSGSGPQAVDPATFVNPARIGAVLTADGQGGTLVSFQQGTTATWTGGDWSDARNWQDGAVARGFDDVVTAGSGTRTISGPVSAASLTLSGSATATLAATGALTLADSLVVTASTGYRHGLVLEGGSVAAAGGIRVGRGGFIDTSYDGGFRPGGAATLRGAVVNDGAIDALPTGSLTIDGPVSGTGTLSVGYDATLDLKGAVGNTIQAYGGTLVLEDAARVTGTIWSMGGSYTLDLRQSTGFGGTLVIGDPATRIDLAGVTAASFDGDSLHVTTAAGASFDLHTVFDRGASPNGPVPAASDPAFALVSRDDGHGGTLVAFQSIVEHAPVAGSTTVPIVPWLPGSPPPPIALYASDEDGDPVTLTGVTARGVPAPGDPMPGNLSTQGRYGTLMASGLNGGASYMASSYGDAPLGRHPTDVFDYTVSDGRPGGTATGTVTIVLDRAPTAADDSATVTGRTLAVAAAQGVLANDGDPDGDALFVNGVFAGTDPFGQSVQSAESLLTGRYGDLTLHRDGSYSYAARADAPVGAHDVFTYLLGETIALPGSGSWQTPGTSDTNGQPMAVLDIVVGATPNPAPTGLPMTGTPGGTAKVASSAYGPLVLRYDAAGQLALVRASAPDGSTDSWTYAGGKAVKETQLHADRTSDVFLSGITGKPYTAEHGRYDATGALVNQSRTFAGGERQTFAIDNGVRTTSQFDASGVLTSRSLVYTDRSVATLTYVAVAGQPVLASETIRFPAGGAELSTSRLYNGNGEVTRETQVHADGTRDVYLPGIAGKPYTAEHDRYAASGALTRQSRTFAGQDLQTFLLDADGSKVTDQYDAAGHLTLHSVLESNGVSETSAYVNGVLSRETTQYPTGPVLSETLAYVVQGGAPVLTADTVLNRDGTQSVTGGGLTDYLRGGAYADTLTGNGGNDRLTGGAGADTFVLGAPGSNGFDRITDFVTGTDAIGIRADDYGLVLGHGLTAGGGLDPDYFALVTGKAPNGTQAHGQFLLNASNATLYWDADGRGAGAAVALAAFTVPAGTEAGAVLHGADIHLVG